MQTANNPNKLNNRITVKNLVFLEFADETEIFLRHYLKEIQTADQKFKIISFHPLAKAHLLKHGISEDLIDDSFKFCPSDSHRQLLVKLEEYTNQIRCNCQLSDSRGVKNSYVENLLYPFRCIIGHWLYRLEVVSNAVEYYKPQKIITVGLRQVNTAYSLWVEQSERCMVDIAAKICVDREIILENIPFKIPSTKIKDSLKARLKEVTKELIFGIVCRTVKLKNKIIVAPMVGHNLVCVLDELRQDFDQDWDIVVLDLPFSVAKKYLWESFMHKQKYSYKYFPINADKKVTFDKDFVRQKKDFRDNLCKLIDKWSYREIKPPSWLKLKYTRILESELIDKTYYQAINMNKFFDKWKPAFVLSQYCRGMTAVIGELCRLKKIPSLMIPHGSFTAISDEYSKKEWEENVLGIVNTPYKYLALQTPLIEDFLKSIPVSSKPVVTGPLIFGRKNKTGSDVDNLQKRYASAGEKIILHANTPKSRKGHRFLTYETVDEYVDGITALIKAVDRIKGVHLVIRYRVIDGLSEQELKSILPQSQSYSIACDGNFIDYLSVTDILISYSSSTIDEALQNNIPVILFNKYNRYQHIKGIELLPQAVNSEFSAVYNVNSENNLFFAVKWVVKNHLSKMDGLNHLFDRYKYKSKEIVRLSEFIKNILIR